MVAIPPRLTPTDEPHGSAQTPLPTMYDLPSEALEEPGLPDEFHDVQPQLLSRTLQLSGYAQDRYFTVSDLNLYYDRKHTGWYKRADWFLAVGVPRMYEDRDLRRSYVIWHEEQPPAVVVEFLSEGTEADDLGRFYVKADQKALAIAEAEHSAPTEDAAPDETTLEPTALESQSETESQQPAKEKPPSKLTVYEEYLRVPHYLVYDRPTQHLRYFRLTQGQYEEQPLNPNNPLVWLDDLEIGLGIWQGIFERASGFWLRWCDRQGNFLLTDTELERFAKEQAEQRAEQERLAKEQSQNQVLQAARSLLATGMEMQQVAGILNLSQEQIQWLNDHPA